MPTMKHKHALLRDRAPRTCMQTADPVAGYVVEPNGCLLRA